MAKQTTKPVKFKYSRAVKKGQTSSYEGRETSRQFDEFYNIQTRDLSKMVDGGILEKRISSYRYWFTFLKMCLELQKQDAVLIYKKKEHKIKVDKSMYVGWDLDKVLTMKFDDWWFKQNHRQLFLTDISKVLSKKDKVSNDKNKVTIEFDANRRLADVIKDLRRINNEQNIFRNDSDGFKSNFVINGRVIDATLQNRYNALILKLEGKLSNKEILLHENQYIRATSKSQKGYQTQIEGREDVLEGYYDDNLRGNPNWTYTIHELINGSASTTGAKQILLSVCDGYFLKHPTKTYLE